MEEKILINFILEINMKIIIVTNNDLNDEGLFVQNLSEIN